MTVKEIRAAVPESLGEVAPEADPGALDPGRPLRDQIDSMDFLWYLEAVAGRVEIPESDSGAVATLDGCVEYVATRGG